ncbi:unnamed protein product [Aspergillus oryzae]|uniref:Unnamed protein product n=1 Tax=Aspergillus oryzae TaxID=5062 RepID=A0AAN4YEY1_ASPOZ|nr:unnamed protein product [Aspergillus oryzae]
MKRANSYAVQRYFVLLVTVLNRTDYGIQKEKFKHFCDAVDFSYASLEQVSNAIIVVAWRAFSLGISLNTPLTGVRLGHRICSVNSSPSLLTDPANMMNQLWSLPEYTAK